MAIKVYGDKIVYPDNSEQTTAFTGSVADVYTKEQIDEQQEAQDVEIAKKVDDAPNDGETYARNNKTWVGISDSSGIPDAPVDGIMYGRKDGEWDAVADAGDVYTKTETNDLLDEKADKATTYTKTEVDSSQSTQDGAIANNTIAIQANTDAIAALPTPVDTYTKAQIDTQQGLQDDAITANDSAIVTNENNILTNSSDIAKNTADIASNTGKISDNTTAIGELSGQVVTNQEDIARLDEASVFSSSYVADYPANPNRPVDDGGVYLQKDTAFTYSYGEANAIYVSNTDQMGNVRTFSALAEGDIVVLNQIGSSNYGRYKVKFIIENEGFTTLMVDNIIAEGTVVNGNKIAVQAFPASAGGDSIWTESAGVAVHNGGVAGTEFYIEQFSGDRESYIKKYPDPDNTLEFASSFGGFRFLRDSNKEALTIERAGGVTIADDITVNGVIKANRNDNYLNLNADFNQTGTQAVIESKLPLNFDVNGETRMTLDDSGKVILSGGIGNFTTNTSAGGNSMGITVDDGAEVMFFSKDTVYSPAIWANKDVAGSKTVKINSAGVMSVDTTTTYSANEVDGLINAKDEIINKLTERLDALEKRVK